MATGKDLVKLGDRHLGEEYLLGAFAPKDNPNWKGPWDCAEFASWLLFQCAGLLIGCVDNSKSPSAADAYSGAWMRDAAASHNPISLGLAKATSGAVLIRKPASGGIGHVAISRGDGSTIEAHSAKRGVTNDKVDGRRWDIAMLLPGLDYPDTLSESIFSPPSTLVLRLTMPPMRGKLVKDAQQALKRENIDPGLIDGVYGPHTEAAVRAFQLRNGLVPDGELGPQTRALLGL
jgi:cell wall-associated NlpC family hydrolase